MRVLVYDVAAESGGALTILKYFYNIAKEKYPDTEWIFVLSTPHLDATSNIKVCNFPQVKKSWLHRLMFDKFGVKKLLKEHEVDCILNLQNVAINTPIVQYLYMHQSLPFIEHKFSLRDKKLWVYQNIIGRLIKKSCKKVKQVIVQTQWIKDAIVRDCKINKDSVTVLQPSIDLSAIRQHVTTVSNIFFYPANSAKYKNHQVIIDACRKLESKSIDYSVNFTLDGTESDYIASLKGGAERDNLKINWLGALSIEQVYDYYATTTLVFASYVETFGLPLLEARESNAPIIAADTLFAREILDGYSKAKYFNKEDGLALAGLMEQICLDQ